MPEITTVFYSWQSDLPNKVNRGLIETALRQALTALHKEGVLEREYVIDRDTKGTPGSPDIAATIFKKIDASAVVVADVSVIARSDAGRACPNPNVLIELGYALKALGGENLILVFNTTFGAIEELPFDLRGKRIAAYSIATSEEPASARRHLSTVLKGALAEILRYQGQIATYARNSGFATELVSALVEVQLFGNEISLRRINPWLDEVSEIFGRVARWLRSHVHHAAPVELRVSEQMESLASLLDEVTGHVHVAGGGAEFKRKVLGVTGAAAELQKVIEEKGPLTDDARATIDSALVDLHNRLKGWVARSRQSDVSRSAYYTELVGVATEIGFQLARVSYYPYDRLSDEQKLDLRSIAETLHLVDLQNHMRDHSRRIEKTLGLIIENEEKLRNLLRDVGLQA